MGVVKQCSRCGIRPQRSSHRWCAPCFAAYSRAHRPRHSQLEPAAKAKANTRAYSNTLKKRGRLVPSPCERCGSVAVEMHHEDYADPRNVRWLCRPCHLGEHRAAVP